MDTENKDRYSARTKEWEYVQNNYRYPINEEMFQSFVRPRDDGKNIDVIRPRNIIKELNKTSAGRDAYKHIKDKKIPVYILYNVDNPMGLTGEYDPISECIYVYADQTKTVAESTKTIIHEAMHDKLGHTGTRKEEVLCFMEESKHDGIKLTPSVIRSIIKSVNKSDIYKDLPWR